MKAIPFAIIILLLSSVISVIPMPSAQATSGTLTITKDTILTEDHYGNIIIAANNITLDGNGHILSGPKQAYGNGNGVSLVNRTGVTVKNLKIKWVDYGIVVQDSTHNTLTGNTITNYYNEGIRLRGSSNNTITGNNATSSGLYGILIITSFNNILTNNFISNNLDTGIALSGGGRNILASNTASKNEHKGIDITVSHDNILTGNVISNTSHTGILLGLANNNVLAGNTIINNGIKGNPEGGFAGLCIVGSSNTVTGNNISNNGEGVCMTGNSTKNSFSGNTIANNVHSGLRIYNYSGIPSSNTFYRNNFIDNTPQTSIVAGSTGNLFNLPAPIGGNYWSNYDTPTEGCVDTAPSDNFCDNPFTFTGGQDNLPWTQVNGWTQVPSVRVTPLILTYQGYDYNNKGEVTLLVNDQVVAILPEYYAPQYAKIFIGVSRDISPYLVYGVNTITVKQNLYSSGLQNVKVTGLDDITVYSNNTYYSLTVGGRRSSITYQLDLPINPPPNGSSFNLTFQGYDYNNRGEVSVLVNDQAVATLPTSYSPLNAKNFTGVSFDITKYVTPGSNTITFNQNLYSSGVKDVKIIDSKDTVVYSNSTYYNIWVGGSKQSITYKFNITPNTTDTTSVNTTSPTIIKSRLHFNNSVLSTFSIDKPVYRQDDTAHMKGTFTNLTPKSITLWLYVPGIFVKNDTKTVWANPEGIIVGGIGPAPETTITLGPRETVTVDELTANWNMTGIHIESGPDPDGGWWAGARYDKQPVPLGQYKVIWQIYELGFSRYASETETVRETVIIAISK